jgi:molybdenum cofactor biosynthesis protein MoaC
MVDITHKSNTLREAVARAIVKVGNTETITALNERKVPKGDVFEMAKAAGLLAVKNTFNVIPDCHPLPVEFAKVSYHIEGNEITIEMHVKTIYKTGVEVEAMHGVAVVALTFYDMLKPIDKNIEILSVKLLSKKGGKTDFKDKFRKDLCAAVVVCSDLILAGKKEDKAGKYVEKKLIENNVKVSEYKIIPDDELIISKTVSDLCNNFNLLIVVGGTGISARDVTTKAIKNILDSEIPGIMEYARNYGQERTPFSIFSRSIAGVKNKTLILVIPGSGNGASETMDALFPFVLHAFKTLPL